MAAVAAPVNNYFLGTPKKPIRYLAIGFGITSLVLAILSISFILKASLSPSKSLYKYGISCGLTALVVPLPIAIFILFHVKAKKQRQAEFEAYKQDHPQDDFTFYIINKRSPGELICHLREQPEALRDEHMLPLAERYYRDGEERSFFDLGIVTRDHQTIFLTHCATMIKEAASQKGSSNNYSEKYIGLVKTIINHDDIRPLKILVSCPFDYSFKVFMPIQLIRALRMRLERNNGFVLEDIECALLKELLQKSPNIDRIQEPFKVLFHQWCAMTIFLLNNAQATDANSFFANQEELVLNIINYNDTTPVRYLTKAPPSAFSEGAIEALRARLANNNDFTLENIENARLRALLEAP